MSCLPPLFSKATIFLISFVYLLAALWTSYGIVRTQYVDPDDFTLEYIFVGGLTDTSVEFRVRNNPAQDFHSLIVTTTKDYTPGDDVVFRQVYQELGDPETVNYFGFSATGLEPDTEYYYKSLHSNDRVVTGGRFRTAPPPGSRQSFSFIASGCSWSGSDHLVFSEIRKRDPLFFAHLGDFHYGDLFTQELSERIHAIDNVMKSDHQRQLYANIPLVYMWDDHDWLGNDSGANAFTKERRVALASYVQAFPYYRPLPSPLTGLYQAFTIGRVRVILTDLRSEAYLERIYSNKQKMWLQNQIRTYGASDDIDFLVWIGGRPWIYEGDPDDDPDSWAAYPDERQELSDFILEHTPKRNFLAMASDAHMVSFDDGTNTYYGKNQTAEFDRPPSFPFLQTGPLDRIGSFKGGPYTEGCMAHQFERSHQFTELTYIPATSKDESSNACIKVQAFRIDARSTLKSIYKKDLCLPDIYSKAIVDDEDKEHGSCNVIYFSDLNRRMVFSCVGLLLLALVLPIGVVGNWWQSLLTSAMIGILFFFTFVAGFLAPYTEDVSQYNAFETILIGLLQIVTTDVHLIAWRIWGPKKGNKAEEEEDDGDKNGDEAGDEDRKAEDDGGEKKQEGSKSDPSSEEKETNDAVVEGGEIQAKDGGAIAGNVEASIEEGKDEEAKEGTAGPSN